MTMIDPPPIVLSFAATDPTGGAGLAADFLTCAAIGCHCAGVVTGITVQDTRGVFAIQAASSETLEAQARAILEDMPVAAFKIGVAASADNIAIIAEIIADYPDIPVVLDPVLASGRGDPLADEEMIAALADLIIPQTTIITPNTIEVRQLAEEEGIGLRECAETLLEIGAEYVLLTGTHEPGDQVINTLYAAHGTVRTFSWPRLPGSYHGSGCTLASAIASLLAQGLPAEEAVEDAQDYTWNTLKAAFTPGMGQAIPNRFFWLSEEDDEEEGH
jgi:hydroxymethylpyrimidine/phosphomethylpyrimidine kinase